MRILTGGHAIWMGGWSHQVHHAKDVISPDAPNSLIRSDAIMSVLSLVAFEVEPGVYRLPPAYALADGLVHKDHRIMLPDEIDPDYLDRDERPAVIDALKALGMGQGDIAPALEPYGRCLDPEGPVGA